MRGRKAKVYWNPDENLWSVVLEGQDSVALVDVITLSRVSSYVCPDENKKARSGTIPKMDHAYLEGTVEVFRVPSDAPLEERLVGGEETETVYYNPERYETFTYMDNYQPFMGAAWATLIAAYTPDGRRPKVHVPNRRRSNYR